MVKVGPRGLLGSRRLQVLGAVVFGVALILMGVVLTQTFQRAGVVGWDAFTYLAAGERLNDGHPLYALSAGDRPVVIRPPYCTQPLLSPPPIAVFWRPLAALPFEWGVGVWWITAVTVIVATVLATARRAILPAGIALLLLFPSFQVELEVANVNGLLLGGTVAVWLLARRQHNASAGALIAVMAAVKLWPIVLLSWFIAQRRWDAVRGLAIGAVLVAFVSIVGAGIQAHFEYLRIVGSTPPSALSLAGLLSVFGVSVPWIGYAILVFGLIEVFALRNRPELAYGVAVATMVLWSPVVNLNTFMVLFACVAPIAWPLSRPTTPEAPGADPLTAGEATSA